MKYGTPEARTLVRLEQEAERRVLTRDLHRIRARLEELERILGVGA